LRGQGTDYKCTSTTIGAWSADGQKMGKGITLSSEELSALRKLLNKLDV